MTDLILPNSNVPDALNVLTSLWNIFLKYPVAILYFYGPSCLGGWKGLDAGEVCAHLTGVKADFWLKHPDTCNDLLQRHFDSFYFTVCVVSYFIFILLVLLRILRRLL